MRANLLWALRSPVQLRVASLSSKSVSLKVYDMGEVQVHALRGVDMDLFSGD